MKDLLQLSNPKILIVCLIVWTLSNMDQSFFSYAIPGILEEFNLGLEAVGAVFSISFIIAALMMVVIGPVSDRFGRAAMQSVYLAVSALLVGMLGLAGGIVMLTIFRAIGFGFSTGLAPLTNAYVVENVSPRVRGLAMGVLQCGYPLGWFIASLIAAPLLANYGWRSMFFAAFLVIPAAGLFYWILRDTDKAQSAPQDAAPVAKGDLRSLFSPTYRRNILFTMGTFFAFGGAYAGSSFYFPTFFEQTRGYTPAEAASLVGISNGIGVFGYLSAAIVGEFFLTRRNTYIIWALGGVVGLIGLIWFSDSRLSDTLWFGMTACLFFGSLAVLPVLIAELFPQEVRASAMSIGIAAPLNLGFAIFPLLVPFVVGAVGWQIAFSVVVCPLLVIAALAAFGLPNRKSGEALDDQAIAASQP